MLIAESPCRLYRLLTEGFSQTFEFTRSRTSKSAQKNGQISKNRRSIGAIISGILKVQVVALKVFTGFSPFGVEV